MFRFSLRQKAVKALPGSYHPTLLVCPTLVGRTSDLAVLQALVHDAQSGQGHFALIRGEAGIGKSRLVAETKACAADLGFLLLQGNCFRSDRFFPYAPLLELLRAYISAHAATAARDLKPLAPALSRLLLAEARHQRTEVYELLLGREEGYISEAHAVGTEEFLLCLEGSFVAGPLDQEVLLMPGDALWFVADRPHGYRSSEGARVVAMMLYPAVM